MAPSPSSSAATAGRPSAFSPRSARRNGTFTLDGIAAHAAAADRGAHGDAQESRRADRTRSRPRASRRCSVRARPARRDRALRPRGSSQYLSAILMVAPYARHRGAGRPRRQADELALRRDDDAADGPLRRHARADPRSEDRRAEADRRPAGKYQPPITPSSRTPATPPTSSRPRRCIPGSKVTIEGLGKASLQGDVGFADVLHEMGADLVFGNDFITSRGTGRAGRHRRRPLRHARHGADARGGRALRRTARRRSAGCTRCA